MAYQLHRVSVLVVEDNRPMMEITKSLLLTFGVGHVITAFDGETGYKRFCEYDPDIVIADWMMKPMDGITFTKKIRKDEDSPNPYKRIAQVIERPRQFVNSDDFFGPDRRRKRKKTATDNYDGPFRRDDDLQNPAVIKKLQARQTQAHKTLSEIRGKAGLGKGDRFNISPNDIDMI